MTRQVARQGSGPTTVREPRRPRAFEQDPRPLADSPQGRDALAGLETPPSVDLDRPARIGPIDATALHASVRAVLVAVGRTDLLDAAPVGALLRAARDSEPVPTPEAVALGRFCLAFGTVDAVLGAGLQRLLYLLWLVDRGGMRPPLGLFSRT